MCFFMQRGSAVVGHCLMFWWLCVVSCLSLGFSLVFSGGGGGFVCVVGVARFFAWFVSLLLLVNRCFAWRFGFFSVGAILESKYKLNGLQPPFRARISKT
ncbi:uncharacterized protein LOC120000240 isoform X2 [Tripterygium wilfordii]|uniref:uncharacterized protein LOC120000240 isoform X2 n=1 Tax=Tripterygium wilfordii TaxID=458696 RepID=UPI0018F8194E|nr:uncharacterized protein LOC120000240 isoform X2 [Tripterygium wilfordii]